MKLVFRLKKKNIFVATGITVLVILVAIFIGLKSKTLFWSKEPLISEKDIGDQEKIQEQKQSTFSYEEKIKLSGRLTHKFFYGPPGFGLTPNEDQKEIHDVLVLDKPINVTTGSTEFEKAQEGISQLQIINEKEIALDSYLDQKVTLSGSLMAAHTGHHHTPVMLVLEKITSVPKSDLKEQTLKTHTFTAIDPARPNSGIKEFTFNYSNKLDLIEATGYMVGERVRLKPKGERIEDSYLITVDQPSTELGEGILINWEEAPVKFGNNWYERGRAVYLPKNSKVVMVIFNPLSPLKLGSITVAPWDPKRLEEGLQETVIILKSLKEVK